MFASGKEPEIKRDSFGRYRLPTPGDPKGTVKSWTRVTTFAKVLDDTNNLTKWMGRMIVKGLADDDTLIVEAQDASIDDFNKLNRIADKAKDNAGANDAATNGTAIHTLTERIDRGENPRIPAKWKKHLEGYKRLKEMSGLEFPVEYIERVVVIPELQVAGTFDRVCIVKQDMTVEVGGKLIKLKKGEAVVGDVKTNKRLDYAQLSIAVQLAAYSKATSVWNLHTEEWDDIPPLNQKVGFIFHLPSDTGDAQLYAIDLERGWEAALVCKRVRELRGYKDLVEVIDAPSNPFGDDDTDWSEMIGEANSRRELSMIWKQASAAGEWTAELELQGKRRMKELYG
jgi:hypothetical protein